MVVGADWMLECLPWTYWGDKSHSEYVAESMVGGDMGYLEETVVGRYGAGRAMVCDAAVIGQKVDGLPLVDEEWRVLDGAGAVVYRFGITHCIGIEIDGE